MIKRLALAVALLLAGGTSTALAAGRPRPMTHHAARAAHTAAPAVWRVQSFHYGPDPMQTLTATWLTARHAAPWVLLIHGGSWIHGSEVNMHPEAGLMARRGWQAFNLTYRMGPAITYAQQLDDLARARDWIRARYGLFHLDPTRGTAFGFSAGGELAAAAGVLGGFRSVVSLSGVLQPQRAADAPAGSGAAALYGREVAMMGCDYPGTLDDDADSCGEAWRSFAPESGLSPSSPPFYIVQGTDDPVIPAGTATGFADQVTAAGGSAVVVMVPGYGHDPAEVLNSAARTGAMLRWIVAA
jgi:acetyl esterase/lipase